MSYDDMDDMYPKEKVYDVIRLEFIHPSFKHQSGYYVHVGDTDTSMKVHRIFTWKAGVTGLPSCIGLKCPDMTISKTNLKYHGEILES